jgi:hypothetical protein
MERGLGVGAFLIPLCFWGLIYSEDPDPPDILSTPPEREVWELVWNDEIEGDELDESIWGTPPDTVRRDGWWIRKAGSLDGGGHLLIRTFREGESFVDDTGTPDLVFPQFVNGESAGVRNRSRVILRSHSNDPVSGRIRFREASGHLISVPIEGESVEVLDFFLEPWGVIDLSTDGTGDSLLSGAVEVLVDEGSGSDLVGTEVFEVLGHSVSVQSAEVRKTHQSYVSINEKERAAVALYNPNLEESVQMNIVLLDSEGGEKDSTQLLLEAREQIAVYVDEEELFQKYFQANSGAFTGTLNIEVEEGGGVAVVGLIQKAEDQALIAIATTGVAYQR